MWWQWAWLVFVALAAVWWECRPSRKSKERPKVEVLELKTYSIESFNEGPSDTALLLWRLYPTSKGRPIMHPNFIHAQRVSTVPQAGVAVFLIHNGKPVVIEDDGVMFPSDALVAKIRLLG